MKTDRASIQVIEMSYVLPVAMIIVLALVYLSFSMFLFVHSINISYQTLDKIENSVGEEGLYWQLLGNYIDDAELKDISKELSDSLKGCSVLPGLRFESSCSVFGESHNPVASVYIKASYFGKEIFVISKERYIYKPVEFAENIDLGKDILTDFEELKDVYNTFF